LSEISALAALLPPPDRIALFLDVDGTLIGPTHRDREAGIAAARLDLLRRIETITGGATAVLTGRSIEAVDELFAPLVLACAGLQGADRRFPGGRRVMPVLTADDRRLFERIAEDVARLFPHIEIEWKPAGMALVYDEGDPVVGQLVALATDRVDGAFRVMRGRVAIDIVPPDADKGRALGAFMAERAFAGRVPVHFGDDVPDEPAFVAARQFGGFGVTVGRAVAGVDVRLRDHEHTWAVLEAWARTA
jgi:trehalose 6-phosphate phosphatase